MNSGIRVNLCPLCADRPAANSYTSSARSECRDKRKLIINERLNLVNSRAGRSLRARLLLREIHLAGGPIR